MTRSLCLWKRCLGLRLNLTYAVSLSRRGSLTTLRCIIKRMVVKNQEARDALEEYLKKFDIGQFPGENVPTACLRLKAVAASLSNDNLPKNVLRKTGPFNEVCTSQLALRRGSISQTLFKSVSLHTQLIDNLSILTWSEGNCGQVCYSHATDVSVQGCSC